MWRFWSFDDLSEHPPINIIAKACLCFKLCLYTYYMIVIKFIPQHIFSLFIECICQELSLSSLKYTVILVYVRATICLQSTVTYFFGLCKEFSSEKIRPNTRSVNIYLRTTNDQQLCLFWSHRQGKRRISAHEVSSLLVHTVLIGLLDKENTAIGTFFSHTNIYESNKRKFVPLFICFM